MLLVGRNDRQSRVVCPGVKGHASSPGFVAATVVLQKEDYGIFKTPSFSQYLKDSADSLVHVVDHCGIGFHAGCLPHLVFHIIPVCLSR